MPPKKGKEEPVAAPPPTLNTFPEWSASAGNPAFAWETVPASNIAFSAASFADAFSCLVATGNPNFSKYEVQSVAGADLSRTLFSKMVLPSRPPTGSSSTSRRNPDFESLIVSEKKRMTDSEIAEAASDSARASVLAQKRSVGHSTAYLRKNHPGFQESSFNALFRSIVLKLDMLNRNAAEGSYLWELIHSIPALPGKLAVKLFFRGCWRCVVIDDAFPVLTSEVESTSVFHVLYTYFNNCISAEFWPAALQKALCAICWYAPELLLDEQFLFTTLTGRYCRKFATNELDAFSVFTSHSVHSAVLVIPDESRDLATLGVPNSSHVVLGVKQFSNNFWVRVAAISLDWKGTGSFRDTGLWTAPFENDFQFALQDRLIGQESSLADAWIPLGLSNDAVLSVFKEVLVLQSVEVSPGAQRSHNWSYCSTVHLEEGKLPNPFCVIVKAPEHDVAEISFGLQRASDQASVPKSISVAVTQLDYSKSSGSEAKVASLVSETSSLQGCVRLISNPRWSILRLLVEGTGPFSLTVIGRLLKGDESPFVEILPVEDAFKKCELYLAKDSGDFASTSPVVPHFPVILSRHKFALPEALSVHINWSVTTPNLDEAVSDALCRYVRLFVVDLDTLAVKSSSGNSQIVFSGAKNVGGFVVSAVLLIDDSASAVRLDSLMFNYGLSFISQPKPLSAPPTKVSSAKTEKIEGVYRPNCDGELFSLTLQPSAETMFDFVFSGNMHETIVQIDWTCENKVIASKIVDGRSGILSSLNTPLLASAPAAAKGKGTPAISALDVRATVLRVPVAAKGPVSFCFLVVGNTDKFVVTPNLAREAALKAIKETWGADEAAPVDPKAKGKAPSGSSLVTARAEKAKEALAKYQSMEQTKENFVQCLIGELHPRNVLEYEVLSSERLREDAESRSAKAAAARDSLRAASKDLAAEREEHLKSLYEQFMETALSNREQAFAAWTESVSGQSEWCKQEWSSRQQTEESVETVQ
eukprot:ANDGO_00259.mRNA.1 hypothetical protein